MGCICSKGTTEQDKVEESTVERQLKDYSVQLVAPNSSLREDLVSEVSRGDGSGAADGSVRQLSSTASKGNIGNNVEDNNKGKVISRPDNSHHHKTVAYRIISIPHGAQGEQVAAGWPSWLTSVAGEAIKGWVPRRADSFEKLDKIGQGTYSSVYKARDSETGKIVALKKVRFMNMDPESVRFMAREIYILRRLDHPNVMKLEGLVTSRVSCSLYLVFEYMEHDLAGLSATRSIKFTEPQIKCYMQQLLSGLEHCHSRGVLHRDIKGANLLLDNNGLLKIGDFGLATSYEPDQKEPLTSRVVTLWYRAPELLLGSTDYGVGIDLWSTGCILAEMFTGKPIMPGRTEVEQMHKIFKLCGSPSEEFWKRTKLPLTSFKPQQPYKRRISDTFKDFPPSALALVDQLLAIEPKNRGSAASILSSEFFSTPPLACDPLNLPQYPPSKEFDAKLRDEEKRRKADAYKGRGPESVRRGTRDNKAVPTPEADASLQGQRNPKTTGHKYAPQGESVSGFVIEPAGGGRQNGCYSQCSSMIHPSAMGSSLNKTQSSLRNKAELRTQKSHVPQPAADLFNSSHKNDRVFSRDSRMGYVPKNRINYSGPLVPPGGNLEDMLKEHERQILQAVRKARAR